MKKKILVIFGTRPEAIKMAPVIRELEKERELFSVCVCVTAQHRQMLDQVLNLFDIKPDYDLDVMISGQDLFDVTCDVLRGLKSVIKSERPHLVLIHGDTTTTLAAGLAAFYCGIPVGHVEAGLRTHEKKYPFPEEINRRMAGVITDLHFAPTEKARSNLFKEGVPPGNIYITGNTVIDSLFMALEKIEAVGKKTEIIWRLIERNPGLSNVFETGGGQLMNNRLVLVTGHRRENWGERLENVCKALKEIACYHPDVHIVFPVHLNPRVQEPVRRFLSNNSNIHLIDPLDYLPFVFLMQQSCIVITDSGGVQEEAPSLGIPVLVMRDSTERPEAVKAGTVKLVGTDCEVIVSNVRTLLTNSDAYRNMSNSVNPYGDGKAGVKIKEILKKRIGS